MCKANDRVEWCYLMDKMKMLGFCERWTNMIMKCVKTSSYSVTLNGLKREEFRPIRGLRQGDPLSPYLFIIWAEGFSRILNKGKQERRIRGTNIGRGELKINHLLFIDDSILFKEALVDGANAMKAVV